ncbi:MAG: hypothetical protein ACYC3Q_01005 [Gemmatimonadaceae bacterium]
MPELRQDSKSSDVAKGRTRSVPHPRYTLQQVEDLARAAFAMGARHCDQEAVAQAVGYKNSTNGAFKGIRAAASYFGLIAYRDDRFLSVTEPWIDAFHTDDFERLRDLRQEAVQQPELYRALIEEFSGRQLPSAEKLARHLFLTPKYGILKDAADTAAKVFLESLRSSGLVDAFNYLRLDSDSLDGAEPLHDRDPGRPLNPEPRTVAAAAPSTSIPASPGPSLGGLPIEGERALDRIEVQLSGGRKAYLLVPVPLSKREKDRLKSYIDLVLEPEEVL